jgi:hypothetical protein
VNSEIHNLLVTDEVSMGFDKCFLLTFKGKIEDKDDEFTATIPVDGLKDLILSIFKLGVEVQNKIGHDIGFTIKREEK